jgi:Flp pilus assembly protein protease CpaA
VITWLVDPLLRHVLVMLWLLPCAIQDRRTRHVSNWLTVPLFLLAWPVALLTGNPLLTLAVFVGVVVAWRWGSGLGPADGKLVVGLAACAPLALGLGALLELIGFAVLRLRGRRNAVIPGALWLYLGSVLSVAAWVVLVVMGSGHFH